MSTYLTSNRHGYSVRFSPFDANRLVVASSQLYGLAGGGTLYFLDLKDDGSIHETQQFHWSDGLFDVVWSEQDTNIVLSASGDGTLQLWSLLDLEENQKPCLVFREHESEIYSLDWCRTRCDRKFLSASWDSTIKFWDPNRSESIGTYLGHLEFVNSAIFSPQIPNIFSSVGTDGTLKLWNVLDNPKKPLASVQAHSGEVLSCDWTRFDQNLLVTGASDGLIRGWDLRKLENSIFELAECAFAIRRIKFSPFSSSVLVSVGYDFTTRIWDFQKTYDPIEIIRHHSEFVCGLDWNRSHENQIADCGWDSLVHVFKPQSLQNA